MAANPTIEARSSDSNRSEDGYFDLGTYHRSISTKSLTAQLWFDRGLIWAYSFNRKEALDCFEKAIAADSQCAMGYWGLAYASGAYYNKPWKLHGKKELEDSLERGHWASQKARERAEGGPQVERALINAMQVRFLSQPGNEDLQARDRSYAAAMGEVYREFGDDFDVAVLYAESLMNLTPWRLWDPYSGEPTTDSRAQDAKEVLDHAFTQQGAYEHPGLLHFYVHLMEMSRNPESGIKAADRLRRCVPGSGHLNHMPSHLDVIVGDYRGAIAANVAAVQADNLYVAKIGGMNMYTFYRVHNYHSLIYAAMLAGQKQVALDNVNLMEKSLPDELVRLESPPMADWVEAFLGVRAHVLIRFGHWEDILNLELPSDADLYCVTTATLHYAKGVAWASLGNVSKAKSEEQLFLDAVQKVPESRYDWPNKCIDALEVGKAMLAGEIEYRCGNYQAAFEHLRRSIHLDDNLVYSEPWGWMQPTRHSYAALLLEQGFVQEAAQAYAEDLGFVSSLPRGHQHPNNVWALHGYNECLRLLGRDSEAQLLDLPLKLAMHLADVPISSSCFCRMTVSSCKKQE